MCRGYSGIAALVSQRGVLDTKSRFKVDCGPDPPTAEACEDDSGKLGRVVVALEAGRGGMFPCSMIAHAANACYMYYCTRDRVRSSSI